MKIVFLFISAAFTATEILKWVGHLNFVLFSEIILVVQMDGQYFFLVSEIDGNWKILEYGIYDKQEFLYFCIFWQIWPNLSYQNCLFKMKFKSRLIGISWNQWWCLVSLFWTKNTILGHILTKKNQNCTFKMTLGF